ncbi:MAG TPA: hypothetical protein PL078_04225 [Bacillota bacterium]|jgi:hypothetical protein|nr:hypothetical protein [Peptococcaceae bacterium MAG4]NLW37503.1 glycosyltransferase family 2 protein [Peptococcaceae bacterium]HPZ43193.1 hypothetical protein [Bacillota bacterium]HQD75706.1 hypothetical protein [Bacillota bacterium]HUM58562.1 hypothetical protein [Bacillota bacterium]
MCLLISSLLLVLVAGLYHLWKLVQNEQSEHGAGAGRVRLAFLVQDQEPWLEGFFRKLFRKLQNIPRLEVLVRDSGSRDGTVALLEVMSRYYPLKVQSNGAGNGYPAGETGMAKGEAGYLYIDLRKLEGKVLYNAGFFYPLIQFSAGKSQGLSK